MTTIMARDKWRHAGKKDAKEMFEQVFPELNKDSLWGRQVYFVFCYPAWAAIIVIIVVVYVIGLIASK